jgi:hypothetical protein
LAKISRRVLKYRERQRRGAVMRPSTFAAIERRAAAGGAYDPEAVAGAAYWKTLAAKYRGNPYPVRFIKPSDADYLINLYHLARTALAGEPSGRYERMLWASKAFAKEHPGVSSTGAYKDLDGLLSNPDLEKTGGLHIVYSAPNQAYFLMWHDSILRIFPTKAEAKAEMDYLLRPSKQNPRELTVPERHQLKIARDTLKMSDVGARIMGGPTKEQAREIIRRLTGKATKENPDTGFFVSAIPRYGKGKETSGPYATREEAQISGRDRFPSSTYFKFHISSKRPVSAVAHPASGPFSKYVGMANPGYFSETHRKGSDLVVIWANTEAGPYHVQPYVNDGDTAISERGQYKSLARARKRADDWLNDVPRKNPDDELPEAGRLYETFHGREPREILELTDSAVERGEYVNLGDLVEMTIVAPDRNHVKVGFKDDGVRLASTAEGTQLVLIGGNQDISRTLGMFGAEDTSKDLLDLGDLKQIVYDAAKWQTDFTPQEWKHDLGEESGIRPRVIFNQLKKRIFFAGGTYRVERPGIVD